MPPESALVRSHTGDAEWAWREELAATMVEAQHATYRLLARGFGSKKRIKALEVPRPWKDRPDPTRPRRMATAREAVAVLGPILSKPVGG